MTQSIIIRNESQGITVVKVLMYRVILYIEGEVNNNILLQ